MPGDTVPLERVGQVYDRIGRIQDWQSFYEGPAIADLVDHADFAHAHAVFELGCGTGAMATRLLDDLLPEDARYVGVDVSSKMARLAAERVARFGDRATVELVDGRPPLPGDDSGFDRVVALYVFDLLSEQLARELLADAARLLAPGGRLCLVSLTHGTTRSSKMVCSLWNRVWRRSPATLGGCRPIDLLPLLDGYEIEYATTVTAWAVPSQIVIAVPSPPAASP